MSKRGSGNVTTGVLVIALVITIIVIALKVGGYLDR